MRRMRYIVSKYRMSSLFVAVTDVDGGSHLCVAKGRTCDAAAGLAVQDRRGGGRGGDEAGRGGDGRGSLQQPDK